MTLPFILKDNLGNIGKNIPLVQGESRLITVYVFNEDGTPFNYSATISTLVAKIFSNINQASIQKSLAMSNLTVITEGGAVSSNMIGFQFTLQAADTSNMAANNAGLPMVAYVTDAGGNVLELDFLSSFTVTVPAVNT